MFGYTFGVASQGLEILRKSIDIRNRNILNANNPDYAEEEPIIKSFVPVGINLETISRLQNFYYIGLRNEKNSLVNNFQERIRLNSSVESIFQEFTRGLGGDEYLNRMFTSYQNLMKDPTNVGARSELKASAESLAYYIRDRKKDLDRIDQGVDSNVREYIKRVNDLTSKIAKINNDLLVSYAQTYSRGQDYKNLLDERDKYLRELSQYINIKAQEDEIGRVRVETSKGFVLVEDKISWELSYNGSTRGVEWNSKDGNKIDISDFLTGGKIKGTLDAGKDVRGYINRLENVAKSLIGNVSFPVVNGVAYISGGFTSYNTPLGITGSVTLNGSSTANITLTGTETLEDITDAINNANVGFRANVVLNPDGTYSLEVISENRGYSIIDNTTGNPTGLGLSSTDKARLFVGYDIQSMRVNPSIDIIMNNLDYARADEFTDLSREWWEKAKDHYLSLTNSISTTLHDLKRSEEIETALLNSLQAKIQELQGVSIDKEFMEVMKLQRSYQAIAKAITAMDELIQATLNMV